MSKYQSVTVERATAEAGPWTLLATLTDKTTVTVVNEVPAQNSRITLDVGDNSWMTVGHSVNVIAAGLFRVIDKLGGTTQVRLEYLPRTFNNRTSQPIIVGTQVLPGYYVDNTNPGVGQTFHYRIMPQTDDAGVIDTFNTVSVENETQPPGSVLYAEVTSLSNVPEYNFAVAVASDGSYVVTGAHNTFVNILIYNSSNVRIYNGQGLGGGVGLAAAADSQGNFYIGGWMFGAISFGGAVGTLYGFGAFETAWLVKYSPSGTALWGRSFPTGGKTQVTGIAVGPNDDVYITGSFTGNLDFGDGVPKSSGSGQTAIFLAKYSSAGTHLGSKAFATSAANSGKLEGNAVSVSPDGSVWITGYFAVAIGGTLTFGGDTFDGQQSSKVFVARFGSANNLPHLYSKVFGSGQLEVGLGIAATPDGGAVVVGQFRRIDFGGPTSLMVNTGSYEDGFVVKFNSAIGAQWAKQIAGSGAAMDYVTCASVHNADGNIVIGGLLSGSYNFGGTVGTRGSDYNDAFTAKFDAAGNCLWARVFGAYSIDRTLGVDFCPNGDVLAVGAVFLNPPTIDFGDGIQRSGLGGGDGFILKLSA